MLLSHRMGARLKSCSRWGSTPPQFPWCGSWTSRSR